MVAVVVVVRPMMVVMRLFEKGGGRGTADLFIESSIACRLLLIEVL